MFPRCSRARFCVLFTFVNECVNTSNSAPKSFWMILLSVAKNFWDWQCLRRMGSPAFTASPYLSKRSFGFKLSMTHTVLKLSLECSEASWFLVILAQTRGVNGMLPRASDFLNKWEFVSTLTFYPKRIMESLPKTSAFSTLVNTKTARVEGPWILLDELTR
jgi:hypothetical protein